MLLCCSPRAPAKNVVIANPGVRGRPIVTGGPVRTVRTDTGELIRSGAGFFIGGSQTGPIFQNAEWAANRALGLNCMRCGMLGSAVALPMEKLLANIAVAASIAKQNRMYMLLGNFSAAPGAWADNVDANRQSWINIWKSVAARFKDEPHVLYEMVNEPTRWGEVKTYDKPGLKEGLKAVFDAMRAAAPDTVIVWPGAANLSPSAEKYAALLRSFDSLGAGPVDWNKSGLAFHYYNYTQKLAVSGGTANATDGGRAALRALGSTFPLMMTETNWWVEEGRIGLADGIDLLEQLGISWVLLRRAGQTTPSRQSWPLNEGGLFMENKLAQLRSRGFKIPVE